MRAKIQWLVRYRTPAISLSENHEIFIFKVPKRSLFDLLVAFFETCRMVAWYKEVINTSFGNEKWSQGGAVGPFEVI